MELRKTFRFESSHILKKHPGKCNRLHGHSWVLHVYVEGPIDPETNFVKDYAEISGVVKPLIERLDHRHLGHWDDIGSYTMDESGVPGLPWDFYPSSENLIWWIGGQLFNLGLHWSKLSLEETCTSQATLTKEEFAGATSKR